MRECRATRLSGCLLTAFLRGLTDQETANFGFDFSSRPKPSWLKSSSDLMLRISRLASIFAFFLRRANRVVLERDSERQSRLKRPTKWSADSTYRNALAYLAHSPRRGGRIQPAHSILSLAQARSPRRRGAPRTRRPSRIRIVNKPEATPPRINMRQIRLTLAASSGIFS
jgi:hypothetical protein